MDGMDEIVREFLIESNENLDQLDQDLVALESEPGSRELLSSVFGPFTPSKGQVASSPCQTSKQSHTLARTSSSNYVTANETWTSKPLTSSS